MQLSFSTGGLSACPDLSRLRFLEMLTLSFNKLASISRQQLAALPSTIRVLTLAHNRISNLPADFGAHLKRLSQLDVSGNRLTQLPPTLFGLTSLQCLNAGHNQLQRLPDAVSGLSNLATLLVSGNQLRELPEGLAALTGLQVLDVSGAAFGWSNKQRRLWFEKSVID